ncbi:Aldo/keto reductase [Dentipellis sp. KUC8613]|nr:Aldo/keto reductase [Dentipellis sp. KUC8613]
MANTPVKLNDGRSIPWFGFGTGTALYGKDAKDLVVAAIQKGFTHLDGAQSYQNEDSLGAGIAASGKPRSELFVTTKLHILPPGQTVRESLLASLKRLQLDYVDLFLIHNPMEHQGQLKQVWKQFEELQKEGLAKSIGVSNFRQHQLEEILDGATVVPAVNQIEYHPYLFKISQPLFEFHKKHGIAIETFAGLSSLSRVKGPVDPVVTEIAARLSKTAGRPIPENHVLLLWQRQRGLIFITTTTNASRLDEYLSIANTPELTAEELAAIDEAGSKEHHRVFAPYTYWPADE